MQYDCDLYYTGGWDHGLIALPSFDLPQMVRRTNRMQRGKVGPKKCYTKSVQEKYVTKNINTY